MILSVVFPFPSDNSPSFLCLQRGQAPLTLSTSIGKLIQIHGDLESGAARQQRAPWKKEVVQGQYQEL
jgi:hypothetical protein